MITRIPFRLSGGSQPLILFPVHLENHGPFDAILDTGAATTLLAPSVARELRLDLRDTRAARGAAGALGIESATVQSLRARTWSAGPLEVGVTAEVDRIARAVGSRAGVVVGSDAWRAHRLTIYYVTNALTVATPDEPGPDPARPPRAELGFTLASPSRPLVLVPVTIDGRGPWTFALDTGASTTVIAPAVAGALGLATEPMPSLTGGGGAVAASAAIAARLSLGAASLSQVRLAVADFVPALARDLGAPVEGILGYNVLRRFRVTLDWPAGRLRLD